MSTVQVETFVNDVLAGIAAPSDLDDYIEYWHEGYAGDVELHEYIGMSQADYTIWINDPKHIYKVINHERSRRFKANRS